MKERRLKNKLLNAYEYFSNVGHEKNMARIRQLARKLADREFGIAFAGHFSAGKSRMINCLCGAQLLPSSPIPTSANLVRVHSGREDYARVFFKEGKPRKYLAPYDYDMVRSFCKDGDQVTVIELSHRNLTLPDQVVVMDTPGIDSADDAHRLATEDALHLADVIFYVMDYNHVQSELNFTFTRELTKVGKEVYLVVNQIDKHREGELSFRDFVNSTTNAFKSWGVEAAGIFFTSLKELNHPENQFTKLQNVLWSHMELRDQLLISSIDASLKKICDEYLAEQEHLGEIDVKNANEILSKLPAERLEQIKADYVALTEERKSLEDDWEFDFAKGVNKILDNAYLMPTSTRDMAASFLEACQPNFKVGFFGRGKKTEAEINRRRDVFFADIKEKTRSQIEWHVKTYLQEFARNKNVDNRDLIKDIQELSIEPPEEILTVAMRDGAKLTQDGSYVINYTGNVAEGIKNETRRVVNELKNRLQAVLTARAEQRGAAIDRQLADIAEYTEALHLLTTEEKMLKGIAQELDSLMRSGEKDVEDNDNIFAIENIDEDVITSDGNVKNVDNSAEIDGKNLAIKIDTEANGGSVSDEADSDKSDADSVMGQERLKMLAGKLNNTADEISVLPGMKRMAQELRARAKRLDNKGFMVTLFGAFSAGKSSFANSLLGERLLPVSPNPTTAAINKIMPVDAEHPHGTVLIKLKDKEMMLDDVNRAMSAFDMQVESLEDAGNFLGRALADARVNRQRQKSFLRAFQHGYRQLADDLGNVLHRGLDDFAVFAAEEDKSCFVEWIEVYYDCPFTSQGITLVDTPGADSINARHTDMSFNFIRQSDVILFVTYYNHAFSRADREFLIQLGRVKDAFAMDKMFFIVNAIDLAENAEEEAGVVEYVRQQLRNYGVHRPQLHALSSQQNLEDKLKQVERSYPFEDAFYKFVFNDLAGIVADAAEQEQKRAEKLVEELIKASREDVDVKKKRKEILKQHKDGVFAIIDTLSCTELQNTICQEIDELTYYVKQRVFLRFLDFFRESFNPADLRASGNTNKLLHEALKQLLYSMGFDLSQELRATTLRMEKYLQKNIQRWQINLADRLREIDREITLARPKVEFESGLEYKVAFDNLDTSSFEKILSKFKSPRHFFEEGGSKIMAEEMEKIISVYADEYLQIEKKRMSDIFVQEIKAAFETQEQRVREEISEFYAGHLSALEGGVTTDELLKIQKNILK